MGEIEVEMPNKQADAIAGAKEELSHRASEQQSVVVNEDMEDISPFDKDDGKSGSTKHDLDNIFSAEGDETVVVPATTGTGMRPTVAVRHVGEDN